MRRRSIILGILAALLAGEFLATVTLTLLLYQATPKSVLAQQTFIGRIPWILAGVRVLDRSFNALYFGPSSPEPLPHYELQIDPQDLQKIEESLPKDLPSPWYGNVFLTEDAKQWVKGVLREGGDAYEIRVRVRGDIFNHWAYRKKSWRIRFTGGRLFHGSPEINLIIPEDRGWIAEPLNAFRAKKLDFVQPSMRFVTVSLNGGPAMAYTEIEQFSKEMLERQGRPGDVNIFGTGGGTSYFQQWDAVFEDAAYWQKYEEAITAPSESYDEIAVLLALSRPGAHREPGYLAKIDTLFDRGKLIRWYGLSLLAGSRHVRDHNLRFFSNPSRGTLEPIPWDLSLYWPQTLLALPGNPFLNELFRVPAVKLATYRFVWEYINDSAKVEEDLAEAARLRALVERAAYRDSVKLQSNRQVRAELDERMRQIQANIDFLKEELALSEVLIHQRVPTREDQARGMLLAFDFTVRGISPALFAELSVPRAIVDAAVRGDVQLLRDDGDGFLGSRDRVVPLALRDTPDKKGRPVLVTQDETLALLAPGEPLIGENEVVAGAPHTAYRYFLVRRGGSAGLAKEDILLNLDVRNAVTETKAQVLGEIIIDDRTFEHLPLAYADRVSFLRRNPTFNAGPGNSVVLGGAPIFTEDVVIPSGLHVRMLPGTTVRMGSGVSILSYSPVTIVGEPGSPVRVLPATEHPWGVFLVLNAEEPSRIAWAEFEGGGEDFLNDTYATGMVAFHGSPVTVRNSIFRGAHGDDALNIKEVPIDVASSRFEDNALDGIDVDVAPSGVIEDSQFLRNGGDGIDLSWSPITIRRITVDGGDDKCISVGESSKPLIQDSTLKGCAMGIAVKDGSQVRAERVRFIANDTAISAYIKKPIFGPPSIEVHEGVFERNGIRTEAMSGATITIQ